MQTVTYLQMMKHEQLSHSQSPQVLDECDYVVPPLLWFSLFHSETGQKYIYQVAPNRIISIGRSSTKSDFVPSLDLVELQARQYGISRFHAAITTTIDKIFIVDNCSRNGTFINGKICIPNQTYELQHRQQLSLGLLTFTISILPDYGDL